MTDMRQIINLIESETGTFQMWHGSRRWDGSPEIRAPRAGRYEAGPGIYLTTHYATARKYAKGGGTTFLVTVDRSFRLAENVVIPLEVAIDFVKQRMRHKAKIIADLKMNAARQNTAGVIASVLINLTVNYEAGAGNAGLALAKFLREQGVDASLEAPTGQEQWLVVINPRIIRSMTAMPAAKVSTDLYQLPRVP